MGESVTTSVWCCKWHGSWVMPVLILIQHSHGTQSPSNSTIPDYYCLLKAGQASIANLASDYCQEVDRQVPLPIAGAGPNLPVGRVYYSSSMPTDIGLISFYCQTFRCIGSYQDVKFASAYCVKKCFSTTLPTLTLRCFGGCNQEASTKYH